jgi:AraC-like DNA-binding protein
MRPLFQQVLQEQSQSFTSLRVDIPDFTVPLHYHPEYEIMYVRKSFGTRVVGDSIDNFSDGDLVMVGPNIPHVWKADKESIIQNASGNEVYAYVILFKDDIFGSNLLGLPEMAEIRNLLKQASRGLVFGHATSQYIGSLMADTYEYKGFDRIMTLMYILNQMSVVNDYRILSTQHFSADFNKTDYDRLNKVYDFILSNFNNEVCLSDAANLISMTPAAFCRYFKQRTQRTFWAFLNEVRISHACKLLSRDDCNISQIASQSGFNNYSNFIEQFKKYTHQTPLKYRQEYLKSLL